MGACGAQAAPSTKQTLEYLYGLQTSGIKPGLERIRALLSSLGDPQDKTPAIHIAGTNGKGSTAAMLEAALIEAGYSTGLYTSPHLVKFNERIRIDGRPVSDRAVIRLAERVKAALGRLPSKKLKPSFFEFTTAMAFECFARNKVDIAVIETGMGGRWDATNTITPLVSIITNIGKEHTEYLGATFKEIAVEKAGIIKNGVPVVTAENKPSALKVIRETARTQGSPLLTIGKDFFLAPSPGGLGYKGIEKDIDRIRLSLAGSFQHKNAALALAALELLGRSGFNVTRRAARAGLRKTRWPARVEVLSRRPLVIVDSAHNPDGATTLAGALKSMKFRRLILVAGCMADKDIRGILTPLASMASEVVLTRPGIERAAQTSVMKAALGGFKGPVKEIEPVWRACFAALEDAKATDAVCVAGSIFTAGEARRYMTRRFKKAAGRARQKPPR